MRLERAAAELFRRRHDFAVVAGQDLHGVTVHVAEDDVLRAAGEHRHAVFFLSDRRRDRPDQIGGESGLHGRRHRFQFLQHVCNRTRHHSAPDFLPAGYDHRIHFEYGANASFAASFCAKASHGSGDWPSSQAFFNSAFPFAGSAGTPFPLL